MLAQPNLRIRYKTHVEDLQRLFLGCSSRARTAGPASLAFIDELIRTVYPAQPPLQPRSDGTPRIRLPR